ncbi:MAG: LPS export ABC transporter permease LptF [Sphingomonas sp.]
MPLRLTAIDHYMARLIAVPLFANLVVAAMLLVLDRIRILLVFVADEGGPVSVVWRMLANLLPEYLGLGIPIGLLLGVLLAFRRLAANSELDVMRAVGVSYVRLLRVPYLFALGLAIANLAIVGFVQPYAHYYYEGLRYELRTGALGASIKVGEFTRFPNGATVRIEQSRDEGRDLRGIFVHSSDGKGGSLSVTAERGQFFATDNPDEIIFRLTNGVLIRTERGVATPRVLRFSSNDLPIPLPRYENFRARGGSNKELTLPQLARIGHDAKATPEMRYSSRAAFHFRLAEVASMFLLPMLGLALGVPPKRSTSGLGIFLAIVMIVTYHKINEYGESIGSLGKVDPFLALWIPFAGFAALVIWMFHTIAFVPGGQPIGGLERAVMRIGKLFRKVIPARTKATA